MGEASDYASVTVDVPELCPRFTARVFTEVTLGPSPPWLKARLAGAGQRPINNVVDITNYVMLLTAQPLHAFDLDQVPEGELIIRTAAEGERMTTLDGVERAFDAETVLVCDRNGPSGIAGIMGGQASEVSESTTRVLLEAATWNGVNILRTSRKLGLRSEASNRFSKQLHPELAMCAQRVASRLMVELCGARLVPGTIDASAGMPPAHRPRLRAHRAESLLGMRIKPELCATYLERLGFGVDRDGDDLTAEVPFFRHYDVSREVDLVEEVGRVHGYDEHLPATLPRARGQAGRLTREAAMRRRAEDVMRDLGFDAVVNLSLTDPDLPRRLRLADDEPRGGADPGLQPPLSGAVRAADHAARFAARCWALQRGSWRRASRPVRVGARLPGQGEDRMRAASWVASSRASARRPRSSHTASRRWPWGRSRRRAGGRTSDRSTSSRSKACSRRWPLSSGQGSRSSRGRSPSCILAGRPRCCLGGVEAGWLGEVHPIVCREWDLAPAVGFQVGLAELVAGSSFGREQYEDVTTYPGVHEDLAIVVDEGLPAAKVKEAVVSGAGELLRSATVFDLYRGKQVGEGRKSLALRLEFHAPDRTLTDARSPSGARRSRRRWRRSAGRSVSEGRVLVAGASGYAGALAASLVWRHPRLELAAATSRADVGARLDRLYPRHRVPGRA